MTVQVVQNVRNAMQKSGVPHPRGRMDVGGHG